MTPPPAPRKIAPGLSSVPRQCLLPCPPAPLVCPHWTRGAFFSVSWHCVPCVNVDTAASPCNDRVHTRPRGQGRIMGGYNDEHSATLGDGGEQDANTNTRAAYRVGAQSILRRLSRGNRRTWRRWPADPYPQRCKDRALGLRRRSWRLLGRCKGVALGRRRTASALRRLPRPALTSTRPPPYGPVSIGWRGFPVSG